MQKIEVLLKKILFVIILVTVMVVFIPIVLLFRVMIEIIVSITSIIFGLYSLRKSLSIKINRFRRTLPYSKIKSTWNEPITLCEGVFDDDEYQAKLLFLFWVNLFQKL